MPHNQSHEEYSFEILVIDTTLQSKYKTTRAIKRFIEADEEIFNSLGVHGNTDCIEVIQKDPPSAEVVPQLSFFIRIKSEKDILNKTREQVINHLRTADFSRVMTINDDVSISIGCEIYPLIARVENTMRAMVVKYFATSGEGLGFWDKTIKITDDEKNAILSYSKKTTFLILTESWCGDAAHVMPVLHKIAELNDNFEIKIVLRDENLELMDMFLTNGARAIAKVIIIDNETGEVLNTYGPRPSEATVMVNTYKKENGSITPEFKEDLQRWYNKNKGRNVIADIGNIVQQFS